MRSLNLDHAPAPFLGSVKTVCSRYTIQTMMNFAEHACFAVYRNGFVNNHEFAQSFYILNNKFLNPAHIHTHTQKDTAKL